jgi:hypothetical protein
MNEKIRRVAKYWGAAPQLMTSYGQIDVGELRPFCGTHPQIMTDWLEHEAETEFAADPTYQLTWRDRKHRLKFWLEDKLDIELSKKHYIDLER